MQFYILFALSNYFSLHIGLSPPALSLINFTQHLSNVDRVIFRGAYLTNWTVVSGGAPEVALV